MFTEHRTMVKFVHLKIFIVFSSFPFILADIKQNTSTAADIDHGLTNGEEFIKNIVHGDTVSGKPEVLVFTAPYRLCEGGCKNEGGNFLMAFPLYIGKKGNQVYREMYGRDVKKLHSMRPNAPFKRKTTRHPFTLCASAINEVSSETTESTVPTSPRCPEVVPRKCRKKTTPALQNDYNYSFEKFRKSLLSRT